MGPAIMSREVILFLEVVASSLKVCVWGGGGHWKKNLISCSSDRAKFLIHFLHIS